MTDTKIIYISNVDYQSEIEDSLSITIVKDKLLGEQLNSCELKPAENYIFVINLHCLFKGGADLMQDQGGVIIYRYLLNLFEGSLECLKVVFYSPLSKEEVIKQKPENYALTTIPFIEILPDPLNPCGWSFQDELSEIIIKNEFPKYNNASLNLLAGFGLYRHNKTQEHINKLNIHKKKVLLIDDEQSLWKESYSLILGEGNIICYNEDELSKQIEYRDHLREIGIADFIDNIKQLIRKNYDSIGLIITDFYLLENHEINIFKQQSDIENISGFQIFETLRKEFPEIPLVFHTTSNKANIYKFMYNYGVDDWFVKRNSSILPVSDLEEYYIEFHKSASFFLNEESVLFLHDFWKIIEELINNNNLKDAFELKRKVDTNKRENNICTEIENTLTNIRSELDQTKYWWISNTERLCLNKVNFETCVEILKDAWLALRNQLKRQYLFDQNFKKRFYQESFGASSIISTLFQVNEFIKVSNSQLFHTLTIFRNIASHASNKEFYSIKLDDCLFFIKLQLELITKTENEISNEYSEEIANTYIKLSEKDFGRRSDYTFFPFALFWFYCQIYNLSSIVKGYEKYEAHIKKRIEELHKLYKNTKQCFRYSKNYFIDNESSHALEHYMFVKTAKDSSQTESAIDWDDRQKRVYLIIPQKK